MRSAILIVFGTLAACHGTAEGNRETTAPSATVENADATVTAMGDRARRAVLLRAIRDAGNDCQEVSSDSRIRQQTASTLWRARCDDGRSYLVDVAADGSAVVAGRIPPVPTP